MTIRRAGMIFSFLVVVFLTAAALGSSPAMAAPQTLTILGAEGNAGDRDAYTEFSMDNGQTWSRSFLYGSHPWGFVSGTNSWINCGPNGTDYGINQAVLYRVKFNVPDDFTNPQVALDVKADNYADIWLNGIYVMRVNDSGTISGNATVNDAVYSGDNEIRILLTDMGGWAGLNYAVEVNVDASTPPTLVTAPEEPIVDTTPPSGSFSINNGAGATNATSVSLHFTYEDDYSETAEVRLSLDGELWGEWQPAETTTFTLPSGDGPKTIYAKFRDEAGNESEAVTQTIILDTVAPEPPVFSLSTTEPTKEVTVTIAYSQDTLNKRYQLWGDHPSAYTEPFVLTQNRTISAYATDEAGNMSTTTVSVNNIDTFPPAVSVTINDGAFMTMDTNVMLSMDDGGTGAARMRFSNDNTTWSAWEDYSTSKAYSLLSGDGLKTVYIQFEDVFENRSQVNTTITLDTIAPFGTITVNGGAALTHSVEVTLTLDDGDTGAAYMQFSDNNETWSDWEVYDTAKRYLLSAGDGEKMVYAKFKDAAGNESETFSASIVLDLPPIITLGTYDGTTPTNRDITVSAATNEGTLNAASHTFTENGSFEFIATDGTGNVTTQTVTITNIDKIAPITTDHVSIDSSTKYVTIQFSAVDNGTDRLTTYYTVNGVQQTGNLIFLNKQGVHVITYWSTDTAGNMETPTSKEVKVAILQTDSNGQFHIEDVIHVSQTGTLQQQDMNGDGIFDKEDIQIMLGEITPIFETVD